jgi:hypothetical protein
MIPIAKLFMKKKSLVVYKSSLPFKATELATLNTLQDLPFLEKNKQKKKKDAHQILIFTSEKPQK